MSKPSTPKPTTDKPATDKTAAVIKSVVNNIGTDANTVKPDANGLKDK